MVLFTLLVLFLKDAKDGGIIMAKKCIKCGQELQDGADFCPECGEKQPETVTCPKCGKSYPKGTTFCSECGNRLGEEKAEPKPQPTPSMEKNFDEAADNLSKAAGGRGKLFAIMGGIIVVLIIAVIALGSGGGDSSSSSKSKGNITIKAEDMINDYIRDQATAENQYKDKNLAISGTVYYKGQFKNTQNYMIGIAYRSAAGKEYKILLDVKPEDVSKLNQLKEGDFINAKGRCVGIVKQEDPTVISIQIKADKINE